MQSPGHTNKACSVAWSPDGCTLISGSTDETCAIEAREKLLNYSLFEIRYTYKSNVGNFKMKHLEIKEADTALALLVDEVTTTHNEILITRDGAPIARIVPFTKKSDTPHNYPLRGIPITISENFDEAMPELWDALGE